MTGNNWTRAKNLVHVPPSLSCVALCVLICPPDPSLRCCASLLLRRRRSFAVRGSGGGVCRRRPAARNSPPGPPSRPVAVAIGPQWVLLFLLFMGISKAVVLLGLRPRSPPIASGRLRSPPVASGRLRSPLCESRTNYRVLATRRKTHAAKSASGPAKAAR